jgi:hypothetical protein
MHRIAPAAGIDQLVQLTHQFRIHMLHRPAPGIRPPHPAVRLDALLQLPRPPDTVSGCDPVNDATLLIPARPSARACAPSVSRHCCSFRCGFNSASI